MRSLLATYDFSVFSFVCVIEYRASIRYITPNILKDEYKFSESGAYYAPAEGDLNSLRQFIRNLPQVGLFFFCC